MISLGARFGYDDDGEIHNAQLSIFDFKPAPIIFEVRGPCLEIDSEKEQFVSGFNFERANQLLRREYREPFVVPEKV